MSTNLGRRTIQKRQEVWRVEEFPCHDLFHLEADGTFTYTPTRGWTGTDSFTYRAVGSECSSEPATVYILVAECPWYIRSELYSATCGVELSIPKEQGILANDPGAIAVLNPTMDAKYGEIVVEEDGSFVYTPSPIFRVSRNTLMQEVAGYLSVNGFFSSSFALI